MSAKLIVLVLLIVQSFGLWGQSIPLQLPEYLELENPKINGECIASGGRVWNKTTKNVILSVSYPTSLTSSSIFYSDGIKTFIHSNNDGHLITQLPGKDYNYNSLSSMLWNYSNNKFESYTESGQPVSGLTFSGNDIYPYQNDVHYTRDNSIYKYGFSNSSEQLQGSFAGTFLTWFLDGGYFLTKQGSVVRLYDKNATLIKLIDMPYTENLGGSGNFAWTYPSMGSHLEPITIYEVNGTTVYSYPTGTLTTTFASLNHIAIFQYGLSTFSKIDLAGSQPNLTTHKDSYHFDFKVDKGPYYNPANGFLQPFFIQVESYDSDIYGNWTTSTPGNGVVTYGNSAGDPKVLNLGRVRSIFGNENDNLVITTSSGHVLTYKFSEGLINQIDTFEIEAGKAELSLDGKILVVSGNAFDGQYSGDERPASSLYVYDVIDHKLIRKWYSDVLINSHYLGDFDFSNDGELISQQSRKWDANVSKTLYFNFLLSVNSDDSVVLNSGYENTHDHNGVPQISSTGNYAITTLLSSLPHDPSESNISKLYNTQGTLINAFTGFVSEWISDTRFVFNRWDSTKCPGAVCVKYYSAHIYSIDGQLDNTFTIPDSISFGTKMVKTEVLDPVITISDHELYVNNSNVIDIKSGRVLFAFDTIRNPSAPVGPDHIVYVKDNKLQIINWRSLSTTIWYRDADGDGFGDPSITQTFFKKPNGFVSDGNDCDDSDKELTPLNSCEITAVEDHDSEVSVFPNPGAGVYYVKNNGSVSGIKIVNSFGQMIDHEIVKGDEFYVIDITKETEGLYILYIQSGHTTLHFKIIKRS